MMRKFLVRGMLLLFVCVPIGGSAEESFSHVFVRPSPMGTNFAVVGARTVTLGMPPTIDLQTQIGHFFFSRRGIAPADALYVIFIGGNDIRDARDEADKKFAKAIIREAAEGAADAVRVRAAAGAE